MYRHLICPKECLTLTCVSSHQVKYKEKFDKEVKGKKPQFDLKESKIYKTLKEANDLASEVGASPSSVHTGRSVDLS